MVSVSRSIRLRPVNHYISTKGHVHNYVHWLKGSLKLLQFTNEP